MAVKKVEHAAPKRQVLTLDDVAAFVQDARQSGATGAEEVAAVVSWRGKVQSLAIEVDVPPADRPGVAS